MIKYVTFDAFDDYGQHVIPVNSDSDLSKTASSNYASEVANFISSMVKKPSLYYVVINALGSFEVWGVNGNGDSFPEDSLSNLSLRSDLGTPNDYGYKTFEYYAKLFKHHVNKPDSPSYGEVIFSYWNPTMHRVELVVGIDRVKGADIVEAMESGGNVAVSMGCKVPWDECSICGNRAKTRAQYCKHTKTHLNRLVGEDTAAKWSKELGKEILPGTKVHTINRFPKFFDISKVHIGADRTAFVLGKAAAEGDNIASVDMAEALGVTDELFDKVANLGKVSEIEKEVGSLGPDDIDGRVAKITKAKALGKALRCKMKDVIEDEAPLSNGYLDQISSKFSLGTIIQGMLASGVFPHPREFQRMALVRSGNRRLADELDVRDIIFNHKDHGRTIDFCPNHGNSNIISDSLREILSSRSFLPGFIEPRTTKVVFVKRASHFGQPEVTECLEPIAAMYNGIKKYASTLTPNLIASNFPDKQTVNKVVGLAAFLAMINSIKSVPGDIGVTDVPASAFEDALIDTTFSGKVNYPIEKNSSQMLDSLTLPGAYIDSITKQGAFSSGNAYIMNDWMAKQASVDSVMIEATNDINQILFNI